MSILYKELENKIKEYEKYIEDDNFYSGPPTDPRIKEHIVSSLNFLKKLYELFPQKIYKISDQYNYSYFTKKEYLEFHCQKWNNKPSIQEVDCINKDGKYFLIDTEIEVDKIDVNKYNALRKLTVEERKLLGLI